MLRKHAFIIANTIVIILIVGVYIALQFGELSFYKDMAKKQAENDVRLTAIDINSNLSNIVTEQLVVSEMMANDTFLRTWCHDETGETSGQQVFQLYSYLKTYQNKYKYDVVFFVSDATKNYYYNDGFNKVLDPNDEFDSWYYKFLKLQKRHDIQVDKDEIVDDKITLFVNCLAQDKGFKTLGVIGVGNSIDSFQREVAKMEKEYDVKIAAVKIGDTNNSFKQSSGYYMTPKDAAKELDLTEEVVSQSVEGDGLTWFDGDRCINIQRNKDLDWNIIVVKDTKPIINQILSKTHNRIAVVLAIIISYAIMSYTLFARLHSMGHRAENTDELTGLYNNKIFSEMFEKYRIKNRIRPVSLFMLDIDDFKSFNDSYGHLYGNTVLKLVADTLKESTEKKGFVSRWGGDEFIGVIFAEPDEAKNIMTEIIEKISNMDTYRRVTCSCGIVIVDKRQHLEENMKKADKALYKSKENGKARCTIYGE